MKDATQFGRRIAGLAQQQAPQLSAMAFCSWALKTLNEDIVFRRAVWALRAHTGEADNLACHNLDADQFLQKYEPIAQFDPMPPLLLQRPDQASYIDIDSDEYKIDPLFRAWCDAYGNHKSLAIAKTNTDTGVIQGIALFRTAADPAFSAQDIVTLETAAPALFDGLRLGRESDIKNQLFQPWSQSNFIASVTRAGSLFDMEEEFKQRLRRAWPQWRGPELPAEIKNLLTEQGDGGQLRKGPALIRCQAYANHYLLVLTDLRELGSLTERELQIARLLADGDSAKAIATQLNVRVNTVMNHRKHVYEKLNIGSNTELTKLVLQIFRWA